MSSPRLAAFVVLLIAACAGWEAPPPNYVAPPVEAPVPSRYAQPPPPLDTPVPPPLDTPGAELRVAIASVQLFDDCPDPQEAEADADARMEGKREAQARSPGYGQPCTQSTVQLAVRSERSGRFRIEAVRVLDGARQRIAGSSTLRTPTRWRADSGAYIPWDERVPAATDLQIGYKLGALDLSRANKLVGPDFNTYAGPFMLELDVSIDGRHQTIRSTTFTRQMDDMVET